MSLIGWQFPAVVGAAALAVLIAVVLGWPRLAGNRPHHILGRVLGILTVNVFVVLLAGVLLNQQFLFYASWTDLANSFGGAPAQSSIHRGGDASRAASTTLRPGEGHPITAKPPAQLPALPSGSRLTFTVHGKASGVTSRIVVQLPPGYRQSAATDYPVLETFQGYPGQPTQWLDVLHLDKAVDTAAADNQLRAPIIVSPQTEVPIGVDSECVDGGGTNPKVETWLTTDVPDFVVAHFHVSTERQSWATVGLSAGGWCAAMAAMRHPGTYSAAIVMGGYYRPWFGPFYRPFEPDSPLGESYNLLSLARRTPPPIAMWIETSHADRDSYPTSAAFLRDVRDPTAVTATVLVNAGHRMSVWENMLPSALKWLGSSVPGFEARN